MEFSAHKYPYPSKRTLVYGKRGMVATSQPQAAQAGLDILKIGGNAVDAAIATAACLTVTEPTSNGIGGDAFAIVWMNHEIYGLNASGMSPQSLRVDELHRLGIKEIPAHGPVPVMVPGAPSAWASLSEKFGRLPLTKTLQPAIEHARNGYPVSPVTAENWQRAFDKTTKDFDDPMFDEWFRVFAPKRRAPKAGEIWASEDHAKTLEAIAETNAKDFYEGSIAQRIHDFMKVCDGYLSKEDLKAHQVIWNQPLTTHYRGYDIWELPPNGHGLVALMALNIMKQLPLDKEENSHNLHLTMEAMKLAYTDGKAWIADPHHMTVTSEALLSEIYARQRRRLIGEKAIDPVSGTPVSSGTVYLATADGEGNMVSYIQSNYMDFGSGLVVPGTGINLQNRGHNFCLEPAHPNCLGPGKRSYHTIIPGFITRNGAPVGPFGVMGGFMQPQGHIQLLSRIIDQGMNPQAALDAPRWQWLGGKRFEVEMGMSESMVEELRQRGHEITFQQDRGRFGRGQMIIRDESGILCGATEPRTDGTIAVW